MHAKPKPRQPWSLRRKLLFAVGIVIIILALGLGIGLGLTLGIDNNDDNDNSSPPTSTLTPLPTPNTTLPWTPSVSSTWQIILSHPPDLSSSSTSTTPNVDIFDIDLFDTPRETIQQLHAMGKKVLCYFSAGSYEDWRPDASEFLDEDLGKVLNGWPGEKWLDLRSQNVRRIMKQRIALAGEKKCDGIDPDNVDAYVSISTPFIPMMSGVDATKHLLMNGVVAKRQRTPSHPSRFNSLPAIPLLSIRALESHAWAKKRGRYYSSCTAYCAFQCERAVCKVR
jgi:hypothetical protein